MTIKLPNIPELKLAPPRAERIADLAIESELGGRAPDWRERVWPAFEDGSCAHRLEPCSADELETCARCGATPEQQIVQQKKREMESGLILTSNKTTSHGYGRTNAEIFADVGGGSIANEGDDT